MPLDPAFLPELASYGATGLGTLAAMGLLAKAQRPFIRPTLKDAMNFGEIVVKRDTTGGQEAVYHLAPDGTLTRVFRVDGYDYSGTSQSERKQLRDVRKRLIDTCGEKGINLKFITKRRELGAVIPERQSVSEWVDRLEERYNAQFTDLSVKQYFVVLEAVRGGNSQQDALDECADRLKSSMSGYQVRELRHDSDYSELYEFYADLINPGDRMSVRGDVQDFYKTVASTYYGFNEQTGMIRFWRNTCETYGAFVVINAWEGHGSDAMIDRILNLPYEITVNHSVKPLDKKKSAARARDARNLDMGRLTSASGADETHKKFKSHFEDGTKDPRVLAFQQFAFFVHAKTTAEIGQAVNEIIGRLDVEFSLKASALAGCCKQAFLDFFPGVYHGFRSERVDSKQVATITALSGSHAGHLRSRWGGFIQQYPSAQGTGKVHVTFHENERSLAGNFAIIGKTGAGKTVLASHFITSATAAHPKLMTLFVTRRLGGYPAVKAAGGKLLSLNHDNANALQLNPFIGPLDRAHQMRIARWLRLIGGRSGASGVYDDAAEQAIEHVLRTLERSKEAGVTDFNKLSALFPTHLDGFGEFSARIRPFVKSEMYGGLFNGDTDDLVTQLNGGARVFALDSHGLIEDEIAASPTFDHVISTFEAVASEQGRPWMVVLDEAPALLRNKYAKERIEELAVEIRKTWGVLGMLFQEPSQIAKEGLTSMVVTQFMTKFYLPTPGTNPALLRDDYKLPERAVQMITSNETAAFNVVMQKQEFTTAFNADLGCLGEMIELLNSDKDATEALQKLERQHNDTALQKYLELKGKYEGVLNANA